MQFPNLREVSVHTKIKLAIVYNHQTCQPYRNGYYERDFVTRMGMIRLGIARTDQVGANYQEAMQYPSLNVRGMSSAAVGDKAANIVPDQAVAELDLRTTPDSNAVYLGKLVEAHIEKQGYHLVKGTPTDDDRARYEKLASFAMQTEGGDAAGTPMDSAVGHWAYAAMVDAFGAKPEPVRIRMMGGTVPTAEIVGALQVPFAIVPLVCGTLARVVDNAHLAEHLRFFQELGITGVSLDARWRRRAAAVPATAETRESVAPTSEPGPVETAPAISDEAQQIVDGLEKIHEQGPTYLQLDVEDVHTAIEIRLRELIGDVAGIESLRRNLADWLEWMGMIDAGKQSALDRYVGYYESYAESHQTLDRDEPFQQEVRNVARAVAVAVSEIRAGRLKSPDAGIRPARPK